MTSIQKIAISLSIVSLLLYTEPSLRHSSVLPLYNSPYSTILTSQSNLSYSHPNGTGPIGRPHWPALYQFRLSAGPREKIFFNKKKNKIKIFCQGGEMSTNSDKYHPLLPFSSPSLFLLTIFPLHPPFLFSSFEKEVWSSLFFSFLSSV